MNEEIKIPLINREKSKVNFDLVDGKSKAIRSWEFQVMLLPYQRELPSNKVSQLEFCTSNTIKPL
jgi:hypothetical protein